MNHLIPTSPALQKGFTRESLSPAFREALKPRSLEEIVREAVETDLEIQEAARRNQDALRLLARRSSQDPALSVQQTPQASPNTPSEAPPTCLAESSQKGTASERSIPAPTERAGHSSSEGAPQSPSQPRNGRIDIGDGAPENYHNRSCAQRVASEGQILDQACGQYVVEGNSEATVKAMEGRAAQ